MDNRFKSIISQRETTKCDKCSKPAVHQYMGTHLCKDDLEAAISLAPQQLRTLEQAIRDSDPQERQNFLRMRQNIKSALPDAQKTLTGIEYEEELEQTTASVKEAQVYAHCAVCGAPLSRKDATIVEMNGHYVAKHANPGMCELAKNHPESQLQQDPQITNAYSPTVQFASKEEKMSSFDREFEDEQPVVYRSDPGHSHAGMYDPWCRSCKKDRAKRHATRRHAQARTIACPFCASKNTERPIPLEHRTAWKCAKCNGVFEHKGEMYSSVAPWLEDKILKASVRIGPGGEIIDDGRGVGIPQATQDAVCKNCERGNYDTTGICRNCGDTRGSKPRELVASSIEAPPSTPVEFITDHEAVPFVGMNEAICETCQKPISLHSKQAPTSWW